jgi:conjugative transfer signal peptidase TraF
VKCRRRTGRSIPMTDRHLGIEGYRFGRSFPRGVLAFGWVGLGLVGLTSLGRSEPLFIYNASASAPIGLYRVTADPIRRGDLVLANAPESVGRLAAERGYLPEGVPLVKRIAAVGGDTVCAREREVFIDGRHVAYQRVADGQGRPMPAWAGCRALGSGEFLLLMEGEPDSFDSRYFGPVSTEAIIGRLTPLWIE